MAEVSVPGGRGLLGFPRRVLLLLLLPPWGPLVSRVVPSAVVPELQDTPSGSGARESLCLRRSSRKAAAPAAVPPCTGSRAADGAGHRRAAAAWKVVRRGTGDPWHGGTRWRRETAAVPR